VAGEEEYVDEETDNGIALVWETPERRTIQIKEEITTGTGR
jgi:hypothetical protein